MHQAVGELRATTNLGRLLAKPDQRDEARATLAEIYGWFSEGFGTADLRDAKALLDEMNVCHAVFKVRCGKSPGTEVLRAVRVAVQEPVHAVWV